MLRQIVDMRNLTFENLDSGLDSQEQKSKNVEKTLTKQANILYQQILEQSISWLTFDDMQDLNLSDHQRKHVKNLSMRLPTVKVETKSKITLKSVILKKQSETQMNAHFTSLNKQSDEQVSEIQIADSSKSKWNAHTADMTLDSSSKKHKIHNIRDCHSQAMKDQFNTDLTDDHHPLTRQLKKTLSSEK